MQVENIKNIKIELRAKYRAIREKMNKQKKDYLDEKIRQHLFCLYAYKRADTIFTYVSKNIEVDTFKIIKKALEDGKKVAVPKCITGKRLMDFYYINSLEDLEPGAFGVLEPITLRCKKVTNFSHGLCIVPGFCFDGYGYRLGYGKGYYDRFLPSFKGLKVGLCYNSCIVNELPHGYFDRPINFLITDIYIKRIFVGIKNNK